ncbi:MAG: nitroreductase family protein [Desulfovibrio sp.]|uniref:nitroreductase family protein n=1 Tax=Desulfovibrio sp. 7SRBS1 TaxID=3378064 RepID=UPI003B4130D8
MNLIQVDAEKCVQCGKCIRACPAYVLAMEGDLPVAVAPESCIRCGHCSAICDQDALVNTLCPPEGQPLLEDFPVLDAEKAELFLRSRRSIRCYKKKPISREELTRLVNIARFAPTASNTQNIAYHVVDNKELLAQIVESVIVWMEKEIESGQPFHPSLPGHVRVYRSQRQEPIFRGAPQLVVATAPKTLRTRRDNTVFCMAYMELFAPSLGLGSCWAGLFELYVRSNREYIESLLSVPEEREITGAVMVGYPVNKYPRLVDRDPLDIHWVD